MGSTDSKQKLGERVIAARRKLEDDMKLQSERSDDLMAKSPKTMQFMLSSIESSFKNYAPFLEPTLLIAWSADKDKCEDIVVNACKKVLSAPITPDEYDWFKVYVLPSSIWMLKTKDDRYMYQELMDIAQSMSHSIIETMDSVYGHLRKHDKWDQLMAIKEETIVSRQDDKKVGMLQDKGIMDVADIKDDDEKMALQTFIDAHAAINSLTVSAKIIDREFQNYVKTMMGRYGTFKAAPMKKVERCLSKLENDYASEQYPKSAKLLDLVRCSVTFNTLEQLIQGFDAIKTHVDSSQQSMKLARVKNGFLDPDYVGGYRDIKINVIFHSAMHPEIKMICEIQLILSQFLHEKKRIHKLYSIVREETYFQMVVSTPKTAKTTDVKQLKFEPVFDARTDVKDASVSSVRGKCSVDSASGLLALEDNNKNFLVYNMDKKKVVFQHALSFTNWSEFQRQGYSHEWIEWGGKKHVSVQTEQHIIRTFAVDGGFSEIESLRISLPDTDEINYCAFDKKSKRIFMVRNKSTLEERSLKTVKNVTKSIKLDQEIATSNLNPLSLSVDGAWCAIGGGKNKNYFYLIDVAKGTQYKLVTTTLGQGHTMGGVIPCFINGESNFVAVGGAGGKFEIWDVKTRKACKFLACTKEGSINCLSSKNNILAIGNTKKTLNLWDVRDWQMFYEKETKVEPTSIHLSEDSKYLTVSGWNGEKCLVFKTNSV
mmetsp:Transcript_42253/g.69642  ORF Transcript_42253/g.69642 Transcript_42253/m.69642 type:complete len:711 (-) Transcript_42253:126-2258(-)